jgi:anthranilate phosphoribosyltransferase
MKLFSGRDLRRAEMEQIMSGLVAGELSEATILGVLLAMRLRGETAEELIGAASTLRKAATAFPRPSYRFADSCGTGGDGSGSINISTAVAFVVAASGLPVAKHGNRSFTSRCGSADVLERLGVRIDAPADVMRRALDKTGVAFLFAPQYHPALRHAAQARKTLGVRTIFNMLGPCLNPAAPPVQLIGVAEAALLEPIAATAMALGVDRALVVHGAGLDEIALHAPTDAIRIENGSFERYMIEPEQAGLARASSDMLRGGDIAANAARLLALLRGEGGAAESDAVALNAGALLNLAGNAPSLIEGVRQTRDALRSGEPARRLGALAGESRG